MIELGADAVALGRGYAASLGCEAGLDGMERLLAQGNGALRQRRAHATGGMPAVLRALADESGSPAPEALYEAA